MRKMVLPIACGLFALAGSAQAAVVLQYDFETDIAGWTGNGQVVGLTQATAAVTGEGVLQHTSGPTDTDPQMNLNNGIGSISPGAGETWTTVTIRQRQFDAPTPNTAPQTFLVTRANSNAGTLMLNKGGGSGFVNYLSTQSAGTSDANGWTIITYDISARGATAFDNMRFDFVEGGNHGVEVDWVRFSDTAPIPEQSSLLLIGLAGVGIMVRRKR